MEVYERGSTVQDQAKHSSMYREEIDLQLQWGSPLWNSAPGTQEWP